MKKKEARYTLEYCSGATCYGWDEETDSREEAVSFVKSFSKIYSAYVGVWDKVKGKHIYLKRVLTFTPEIDEITEEVSE